MVGKTGFINWKRCFPDRVFMGVTVMKLTVPYNYSVQWLDQGVSFRLSEAHGEIPFRKKFVSFWGIPPLTAFGRNDI